MIGAGTTSGADDRHSGRTREVLRDLGEEGDGLGLWVSSGIEGLGLKCQPKVAMPAPILETANTKPVFGWRSHGRLNQEKMTMDLEEDALGNSGEGYTQGLD